MQLADIQTIAVVGLGTMGHGIAQTFAVAGFPVRCYDELAPAREGLSLRVRDNLQRLVEAGLVAAGDVAPALVRLTVCEDLAGTVGPAQFVVEAVAEDLAVKQDLF